MKTRIEEAAKEYIKKSFEFETLKRITMTDYSQCFIAGAEFMQKEAEFWETFVKGLTKDLSFHQNLNKEKFKEIKKLKAQNEIMREALKDIADYGDHRQVASEALENINGKNKI